MYNTGESATDPESSFELIRRVQQGDADALERLLARYVPRLRRWASGRLPRYARDLADTQDLVQEAVVRTLRSLKGFDDRGEGALQAYLRQAVMNRIRDELRRTKRRPQHDELPESLHGICSSESVRQPDGGQLKITLKDALEGLVSAARDSMRSSWSE